MSNLFDVTRAPPTYDELAQSKKREILLSIVKALTCAAAAFAAFKLGTPFYDEIGPWSMLPFCMALIYSFWWFITLDERFLVFAEVYPDLCGYLVEFCEATEAGRAYRLNVLAEGRTFTMGDYWALHAWANTHKEQESCRRLYDIPSDAALS